MKKRDLTAELDQVKLQIDYAVYQLAEARGRMTVGDSDAGATGAEDSMHGDIANLCIRLELALADSVVWAQRLAEKMGQTPESAMA